MYRCNGITKCNKRCKLKKKLSSFCKIHENNVCSICLSFIQKSSSISLSCEHSYCKNCILNWICINKTCPVCRGVVNESLIAQSIEYGLNNKLLIYINENHINISDLSEEEQGKLEDLGISFNHYLNEEEWNKSKHFIDFMDKLEIFTRKSILQVEDPEIWDYFNEFNNIFLFH
jgi:hypothetical protein